MAGRNTGVLPQPRSDWFPARSRSPVVLPAVMAAEGVTFAGLDGSAPWRLVRIIVTLTVTALAAWFTRRAGAEGFLGPAAGTLPVPGSGAEMPGRGCDE